MAENELTERRVYVLPKEQLERIRAYQSSCGISSEVEAVRRLLDSALQMRDTVQDILIKLKSRFSDERDLRVLGRDVLIIHSLVREVRVEDDGLTFVLTTGEFGKIDLYGKTFTGGNDQYPSWTPFPNINTNRSKNSLLSSVWDAPSGKDMDDEIPF